MTFTLVADHIRRLAPRARQDYVDALTSGGSVLEQWGINTPLRLAAFLATICHETGGLTIVRENTRWTDRNLSIFSSGRAAKIRPFVGNKVKSANAAYGDRLGNERDGTHDDDGWDFRGGGMIQLTGYDNYKKAGDAIGVDLGKNPALIEDAAISLQAACWEFSNFLTYCDRGESGFKAVCNGINRGNPFSRLNPIGWDSRQTWYVRACDTLGVSRKVEDDILRLGDRGELVKALQERLAKLGYAVGRADGIFGSRTRAAVLAFQAESGLVTDGLIGPKTRTALNAETATPMPLGERATETAEDLKEAGSTTIERTDGLKAVGKTAMAVSGVTAAAKETGLLETASDLLKELNMLKTTTNGLVDVAGWAAEHWYLGAALAGYLIWKMAKDIEFRRVLEHNFGLNLNR